MFSLDEARAWHAEAYAEMVAEAEALLAGPRQVETLQRLEEGRAQIRTAVAWHRDDGDPIQALRMCNALHRFWVTRGHRREGLDEFLRTLQRADPGRCEAEYARGLHRAGSLAVRLGEYGRSADLFRRAAETSDPASRAETMGSIARIHSEAGDWPTAERLLQERVELYRQLGDEPGFAGSLDGFAICLWEHAECSRAEAYWEESLAIWERLAHRRHVASALNCLGLASWVAGRDEQAWDRWRAAGSLLEEVGDVGGVACCLDNQGGALLDTGSPDEAARLFRRSLEIRIRIGEPAEVAVSQANLASAALVAGRPALSAGHSAAALAQFHRLGWLRGIAVGLEGCAFSLWEDQPRRALALLGTAAGLRRRIQVPRPRFPRLESRRMEACLRGLGQRLGEQEVAAGLDPARRADPQEVEDAIRLALGRRGNGNGPGRREGGRSRGARI